MTTARLALLDEMFPPALAEELRRRGHDVVAVAEEADLRALTDAEIWAWALAAGRWVVTENAKDFRRLLQAADAADQPRPGLLLTSSRTFPRSRRNPRPLVEALDAWLRRSDAGRQPLEEWLRPDELR